MNDEDEIALESGCGLAESAADVFDDDRLEFEPVDVSELRPA